MRRLLTFALSLLGIFDSAYLTWVYTSPSHPMVCLGTGCDVVRASAYSHLAGLPIPVYGLAMYGALALLLFVEPLLAAPQAARRGRYLVAALSGAGFLFSAYLSSLEAWVIHAWCAWCVVSALTVTTIFVLSLLEILGAAKPPAPGAALQQARREVFVAVLAAVIGIPAFWFLARHGELPPLRPPAPSALEAHLIRPDTHFYGNPDAKVTIIEFGDFECPMCGQTEPVVEKVRKKFGPNIRFGFRQFPLSLIHPQAEKAAEASECAAEQGKFWEAVNKFYADQSDLSPGALERYASELGLSMARFNQCLASGAEAARVAQDKADGQALGVRGTPTFFINGKMIEGPLSYSQLAQLIHQGLAQAASAPAQASELPGAPLPTPGAASHGKPPSSGSNPLLAGSSPTIFSNLASSSAGCSEAEAKMRQPELIHTAEARRLFGDQPEALFVDVRTPSEYRASHIAGAINIPSDRFDKNWMTLPKNRTIVLYEGGHGAGDICAMSRAAGRTLLQHEFPFSEVKVYQDGLAAWEKAGLPVKRHNGNSRHSKDLEPDPAGTPEEVFGCLGLLHIQVLPNW